ncbi:MAG TPA: transketolase C-terminal domain-containing protein, partial [Polyangiaceae bacterium]|nr:transketolase C-terminal domain-containing protein [Polyangiaceae bacterium]
TRRHGPTAFALTRQKVPSIRRDPGFDPGDVLRGAYVAQEAAGGRPDCVLVATGSELHLAVGAKAKLEASGRRVRVVSAPCLEAFAEQPAEYRARVLPPGSRRASIEAGRTSPWRAIVGDDGLTIGIDRFGASAPYQTIAEKLGLTVDAVTERVSAWLG